MSEDNHLDSSVPDSTQLGFDGFPEGGSTRKRRITVRQKAVIPVTIRKNFPLINSMSSAVQTNVQQKLLNIVIKYVQTQERDAQGFWTIPFSELKVALNISTNNRTHIAEVVESMQQIKLHFNIETKDINNPKLIWFVFVPTIAYVDGDVKFKVNPDTEHLFSKEHRYAMIDERDMAELKLQCSVRLLELCAQNAGMRQSAMMDWKLLRAYLMAQDYPKKASHWSGFLERYLLPAINEVSIQTKYNVELEVIKRGNAVHAVRLIIEPKSRQQLITGISDSAAHAQMRVFLEQWPLPPGDILALFNKYKIEEIQSAYAHTIYRARFAKYALKMPHRFFLRSLENQHYLDYANAAAAVGLVFVQADKKSDAPGKGDIEDTVTNVEIEKFIAEQRSEMIKEEMRVMASPLRQKLYAEYNAATKDEKFHLNIVNRNRVANLAMFRHWYSESKLGAITADERAMAKDALISKARG